MLCSEPFVYSLLKLVQALVNEKPCCNVSEKWNELAIPLVKEEVTEVDLSFTLNTISSNESKSTTPQNHTDLVVSNEPSKAQGTDFHILPHLQPIQGHP